LNLDKKKKNLHLHGQNLLRGTQIFSFFVKGSDDLIFMGTLCLIVNLKSLLL